MITKDQLNDKSLLFLIITNISIIIIALIENWDIIRILFIYWFQSIFIGFFHVIKLLTYENKYNQKTENIGKIFTSVFFIFHYGFFHLIYLFFLLFLGIDSVSSPLSFFNDIYFQFMLFLLFINHLFSFLYNKYKNKQETKDFGRLFIQPYARIIPMHLTIIFGTIFIFTNASQIALVIFLFIKTSIDIISHISKHKK